MMGFPLFQRNMPTPVQHMAILDPLPPRTPCTAPCNDQEQSPFFSTLPAEVRNEVYRYYFDSGVRELLSLDAHPLSLLLTCRKINREATNLAFNCHTFDLSESIRPEIYQSLRNATAHLSSQQVDAITAVSYDQRRKYIQGETLATAKVLANAICVFPSLSRFEIRNLRSSKLTQTTHHAVDLFQSRDYKSSNIPAVQKYAPVWFVRVLHDTTSGYAYAWQADQRWKTKWPQLKDMSYVDVSPEYDCRGELYYVPTMSPKAIGVVRGVQPCPCPCANIEWTCVDLVQVTGRIVTVSFSYHGPADRPSHPLDEETILKAKLGARAVILKEGAPQLDVVKAPDFEEGAWTKSLAYEASEEYWEGLRRRNGDWRILLRDWWRGSEDTGVPEKFPGSKSLGEGDWARLSEMRTSSEVRAANTADNAESATQDTGPADSEGEDK